ncbi:MAG: hypothetical protein JXK07_10300 [Spirochaetes bacterium]|nr:hypothetical protein [Spirochaetota bacterium]MBN2772314.1 hypothetical protein [Spirochaetota bacterium]
MKDFLRKHRFETVLFLIFFALISRLAPHPSNFTPLTAVALFSAAFIKRRSLAFLVPAAGFFASDMILNLVKSDYNYGIINLIMYLVIILIASTGLLLGRKVTIVRTALFSIAGSSLFFIITNFAVWFFWDMYPKTVSGLISCYTAGIPFFRNMAAGDLVYTGLLFGSFALVARYSENREVALSDC